MKVNSHNEWDKLVEIIVGTAQGTVGTITWPLPGPIPEKKLKTAQKLIKQATPQWFYDEVNEDLEGLANIITDFGAKVLRPTVHDLSQIFSTPYWSSNGNNSYNVRDLHLVVGNTIIQTPSPTRSRYFEQQALYPIFYEYFQEGFRWSNATIPTLNGDVKIPYFRDENERILTDEDLRHQELTGGRLEKLHKLTENEILFDAANTVRMGKDLLYLVSSSGNYAGAKWLQSVLGDKYRVHTTEDIYRSSHLDSTVLCLKPGLVLLNSARVTEKTCPPIFKDWDKIYFSDVAPIPSTELDFQNNVRDDITKQLKELGFETGLSDMCSPWVGMNVLSLDQETVLADERQTELIKELEKNKMKVIPVRMRHIYTQGGGLHCATLDTVRESKFEDYFG